MASHIGPVFEKSQFVSGVPLDLIMKAGMMKDQAIEQNINTFKNNFQKLASHQISNQESAKYISDKLNSVTNELNSYLSQGGIDFSKQENLSTLDNIVGGAIDDEFMRRFKNDIEATSKYKRVEALKQIGDDKFGENNYQVFMNHFNNYINDPTGSKMNYNYVDYVDTNKAFSEAVKDIKPEEKITTIPVQTYDASGKLVTVLKEVKTKEISRERVNQAINGVIDNKLISQMRVDYDAKMMNSRDSDVKNYFTTKQTFFNNQLDDIVSKINYYKSQISDDTPPQLKSYFEGLLENAETTKKEIDLNLKNIQSIITHPDAQSGNYFKNKYDFNTFLSDKMGATVGQYAITESVKTEYDPLSMYNLKEANDIYGKGIDHQYRMIEQENGEKMKALYGNEAQSKSKNGSIAHLVAGNDGVNFSDGPVIQDEFLTTMSGLMFSKNGSYQTPVGVAAALLNTEVDGKGDADLDINSSNSFIDIANVDEEIQVNADKAKSLYTSKYYSDNKAFEKTYEEWYAKNRKNAEYLDYLRPGNSISRLRGESSTNFVESLLPGGTILKSASELIQNSQDTEAYKDFLKSDEYKTFLSNNGYNEKSTFTYDPKYAQNYKKASGIKSDKAVEELLSLGGPNIGSVKFKISTDVGNVINTNGGDQYVKGHAILTSARVDALFANSPDLRKELEEKGKLVKVSSRGKSDSETTYNDDVYQLSISVKSNVDLQNAHNLYFSKKSGDKSYDELEPARMAQFENAYKIFTGYKTLALAISNNPGALYEETERIKDNFREIKGILGDKEVESFTKQGGVVDQLFEVITDKKGKYSQWKKMDATQRLMKLQVQDKESFKVNALQFTGGARAESEVNSGTPLKLSDIPNLINKEPEVVTKSGYSVKTPISVQHHFGNNHSLIAALLDAIAISEGGEYDIAYNGQKFSGFASHPGQKVRVDIKLNGKDSHTTAAGKYQITASTWNEYGKDLNNFSPANQDIVGWRLLKDKRKLVDENKLAQAYQTKVLTLNRKTLGDEWDFVNKQGTKKFEDELFKRTGIRVNWV